MRRWLRLSAFGAVVLAACAEPPSAPRQTSQSSQLATQQAEYSAAHPAYEGLLFSPGSHVHVLPTRGTLQNLITSRVFVLGGEGAGAGTGETGVTPFSKTGGSKTGGGTGIFYHGGPIILTPQIAAIYWYNGSLFSGGPASGSGTGSADGSNVGLFMRSLGGTGYWNINSTYYNGSGQTVPNSLAYTGYWVDTNAPASGASVSDAAVQAEVVNAFNSGGLTYNPNTLYAVFSGPGVNLGGGAGTSYCAYHGHFTATVNGTSVDVKYAVMPYDVFYGTACAVSGASPTSDAAAAAEVNVLAHETEETMTDEDLNAWYDRRGEENADKCAWKFGTTSSGSTGTYNQTMGGTNWLIQMNWVDAGSGGCLQSF